jgi:hypothetical protein
MGAERGHPPILAERAPSRRRERGGLTATPATICSVSRRDLVHVLEALWRLSRADPELGVPVADIDRVIGRGHGDMRTPLNLQALSEQGLTSQLPDGTWALTPQGIAWLEQDRELSDR